MGRPLRTMPLSVVYVLIILGLNVLGGFLLLGWVQAVVAAALLVAVLSRQRMAWQWGRLAGALGGGLLFFTAAFGLIMAIRAGRSAGILIAGGQMIDGLLALGICYALSRRSALQYFDLICPACGADATGAGDFLFKTVRCASCTAVWSDSAEYVRPEFAAPQSDGAAGVLDALPVPLAPGVARAATPSAGPPPDQAKHLRSLLLILAGAGGLALLLVCGSALYIAATLESPDGWTVLLRSRDPKIWNRDVNRGANDFARSLSFAPEDMAYLRLTNTATGDFIILALRKDQLRHRNDERRFGWDGTNDFEHQGHHLGISDRVWGGGSQGDVFVSSGPHLRGWGFGHVIDENNRQGYSWAANPLPPTVFEIAVKPGPLTAPEAEKLLAEK